MVVALQNAHFEPLTYSPSTLGDLPRFAGVSAGRELTLKHRRIPSGLSSLDKLLDGGIVRGRISEITGAIGAGKTSLAMAFAAQVTRAEAVGWIETGDSFDPASMIAAGIRPERMLWVSCRKPIASGPVKAIFQDSESDVSPKSTRRRLAVASLKAAEWVLAAGGFGLLVLDFGEVIRFVPQSSALRLARAAERSGAALVVLASSRICGTFAALSLNLTRQRASFSRTRSDAPVLFDGQMIQARVLRNKLGGSGGSASWRISTDPSPELHPAIALHSDSSDGGRSQAVQLGKFTSDAVSSANHERGTAPSGVARIALRTIRPAEEIEVLCTREMPEFVRGKNICARVISCASPWRYQGEWWAEALRNESAAANSWHASAPAIYTRDYYELALADGAVYRVFRDLASARWYVDGIYD